MSLTLLAPIIAACISALGGIGTALYHLITARQAAESTSAMVANKTAATDLSIEAEAEQAVEASDKGDLAAERKGDAE